MLQWKKNLISEVNDEFNFQLGFVVQNITPNNYQNSVIHYFIYVYPKLAYITLLCGEYFERYPEVWKYVLRLNHYNPDTCNQVGEI